VNRPIKGQQALAVVDALNHEGQGVARLDGKVAFIDGALPQEKIRFLYRRQGKDYDLGSVTEILHPSPWRQDPPCPHFGRCGGCSLQHLDPYAQVAVKERLFEENLQKIANIQAKNLLFPILWAFLSLPPSCAPVCPLFRKKEQTVARFP